jgi:chromosome partitioning protein
MTPVVTFFNNKGGVGKTSLVYHLAWMYAVQGTRVLVADLDPQANLTALLFEEFDIERLWEPEKGRTIFDPIRQMIDRDGGLGAPHVEAVGRNLSALVGTPRLAGFESDLAENWLKCLDGKPGGFKVMRAFWSLMQAAADKVDAQVVLADVGPSLGAINRAALVASDHVVMPLGADLFSLAGIENLGQWLGESRRDWAKRMQESKDPQLTLPAGRMAAAGYVLSQHAVERARNDRNHRRSCVGCELPRHREALPQPDAAGAGGAQADLPAPGRRWRARLPRGRRAAGLSRLLRAGDPDRRGDLAACGARRCRHRRLRRAAWAPRRDLLPDRAGRGGWRAR